MRMRPLAMLFSPSQLDNASTEIIGKYNVSQTLSNKAFPAQDVSFPPVPKSIDTDRKCQVSTVHSDTVSIDLYTDDVDTISMESVATEKPRISHVVHLQILCARDLPGIELNERLGYTCDPFVEIHVASKDGDVYETRKRTDTVFQSVNPDFIEEVSLPVSHPETDIIHFQVFHDNSHHFPSELDSLNKLHSDTQDTKKTKTKNLKFINNMAPMISLGKGSFPVASLAEDLTFEWIQLSPNRGKLQLGMRTEKVM